MNPVQVPVMIPLFGHAVPLLVVGAAGAYLLFFGVLERQARDLPRAASFLRVVEVAVWGGILVAKGLPALQAAGSGLLLALFAAPSWGPGIGAFLLLLALGLWRVRPPLRGAFAALAPALWLGLAPLFLTAGLYGVGGPWAVTVPGVGTPLTPVGLGAALACAAVGIWLLRVRGEGRRLLWTLWGGGMLVLLLALGAPAPGNGGPSWVIWVGVLLAVAAGWLLARREDGSGPA